MPSHQSFDLDQIAQALFREPTRSRLLRAYGIDGSPATPQQLCEALWQAFGQTSLPATERQPHSPEQIFRAAARSLASNSRNWSTFLKHEKRFNSILQRGIGSLAATNSAELENELAACLPGLTSGSDARAVLAWARLLHDSPDWGERLEALRVDLREQAGDLANDYLDLPMVAIAIADTRSGMKAPSMGAVLAAEFLRNLRWPGYKPDRHVIRLVRRWAPDVVAAQEAKVDRLMEVLGRRSKEVRAFLEVSLASLELTPAGTDPSQVDNLIWALGAMVEKKGLESDTRYLTTS